MKEHMEAIIATIFLGAMAGYFVNSFIQLTKAVAELL